MLATIAVVLIVLWLAGLFVFKITGAIIHLALIIGVVLLVMHFIRGRRAA